MTFDIRRVGPGDAQLFGQIAPEVFDEPVRTDRLATYLAQLGHHMIVAHADGQVVGQCAAVIHRHPDKVPELYIDEVGTALGYRRRGIARAMVVAMLTWGQELGCKEFWVGTETGNEPACALYAGLGVPDQQCIFYEGEL